MATAGRARLETSTKENAREEVETVNYIKRHAISFISIIISLLAIAISTRA